MAIFIPKKINGSDSKAQNCVRSPSKVTGGGLIIRETACKYLPTSLQSVQNAVKIRLWETTSTPLLAFRNGLCAEWPRFRLDGVMSNLAFIFKQMWKLKVSHLSLLSIKFTAVPIRVYFNKLVSIFFVKRPSIQNN